eukprot:PhF_6_TR37487/c2_g1_i1/m.55289
MFLLNFISALIAYFVVPVYTPLSSTTFSSDYDTLYISVVWFMMLRSVTTSIVPTFLLPNPMYDSRNAMRLLCLLVTEFAAIVVFAVVAKGVGHDGLLCLCLMEPYLTLTALRGGGYPERIVRTCLWFTLSVTAVVSGIVLYIIAKHAPEPSTTHTNLSLLVDANILTVAFLQFAFILPKGPVWEFGGGSVPPSRIAGRRSSAATCDENTSSDRLNGPPAVQVELATSDLQAPLEPSQQLSDPVPLISIFPTPRVDTQSRSSQGTVPSPATTAPPRHISPHTTMQGNLVIETSGPMLHSPIWSSVDPEEDQEIHTLHMPNNMNNTMDSADLEDSQSVLSASSTTLRSRVLNRLSSTLGIEKKSTTHIMQKTVNWKRGALLGRGAWGDVHLGLNQDTGELMAVKRFCFDAVDPNLQRKLQMLQNEITILKRLDHENIVRYFFVERVENGVNIFMEYVPGGSIQSVLKNFGALTENVVVQYTHQILLGLAYLHRNHVLHSDIKGANILLTVDGIIKLADFGSATLAEERTQMKKGEGTPVWMAPEIIRGEYVNGWSSDIWSVGCTVMEMLTGQNPWAHIGTPIEVMGYVADDTLPIQLPEGLSEGTRYFLLECLQRNPAMRPTAEQLLQHHFFYEDVEDGFTCVLSPNSQAIIGRKSSDPVTPAPHTLDNTGERGRAISPQAQGSPCFARPPLPPPRLVDLDSNPDPTTPPTVSPRHELSSNDVNQRGLWSPRNNQQQIMSADKIKQFTSPLLKRGSFGAFVAQPHHGSPTFDNPGVLNFLQKQVHDVSDAPFETAEVVRSRVVTALEVPANSACNSACPSPKGNDTRKSLVFEGGQVKK